MSEFATKHEIREELNHLEFRITTKMGTMLACAVAFLSFLMAFPKLLES